MPGPVLVLALALLTAAAVSCSPPPEPLTPGWRKLELDFPEYPPAEPYLEYQARLKAYKPPPPPPRYTEKNARIFREVEQLRMRSDAELAYRKRLQAAAAAKGSSGDTQAWGQYQARLRSSRLWQALREEEFKLAQREQDSGRYSTFGTRLSRLQEEEAQRKAAYEQRRLELLSGAYLQYLRRYSEINRQYEEGISESPR